MSEGRGAGRGGFFSSLPLPLPSIFCARPLVPGSARLKYPRWRSITERNGFSAMKPPVTACKQDTLPYKSRWGRLIQLVLTAWLLCFPLTAPCPAGKFSSDGLGSLCRVCPKNSYQDQTGETACKNCEHGTKTLQLAATSADACGGNVTIRAYLQTFQQRLLVLI